MAPLPEATVVDDLSAASTASSIIPGVPEATVLLLLALLVLIFLSVWTWVFVSYAPVCFSRCADRKDQSYGVPRGRPQWSALLSTLRISGTPSSTKVIETRATMDAEMGAKEARLTSDEEEPADVKPSSSLTVLLECNVPVITLTPPPTEEPGICAGDDACLSSDEAPQAFTSQEAECYGASVTFEMIGVNAESESIVVVLTPSLPQCSAPDEKLSSSIADLAAKCDPTSFEDTNTDEWGVIVPSASSLSSSISWDPELSQSIQCLGLWIEQQRVAKQRKTSTCDDEKTMNTRFQLLYGDDAEMKCAQEAVDAEYDRQLQEDFNPLLALGYNTPLLFKPSAHYYDASKSLPADDESSLASSDDSTCFSSAASSMSDDSTCLSPIHEVKVAAGMQDKVAWMCSAGDPCGPFTLHACHESREA